MIDKIPTKVLTFIWVTITCVLAVKIVQGYFDPVIKSTMGVEQLKDSYEGFAATQASNNIGGWVVNVIRILYIGYGIYFFRSFFRKGSK